MRATEKTIPIKVAAKRVRSWVKLRHASSSVPLIGHRVFDKPVMGVAADGMTGTEWFDAAGSVCVAIAASRMAI
jgi:hypothetical protein